MEVIFTLLKSHSMIVLNKVIIYMALWKSENDSFGEYKFSLFHI